jgi:hypothetical protein
MRTIEQETARPIESHYASPTPALTDNRVAEEAARSIEARQTQLGKIKKVVSLKFFHDLSEKVNRERENLNEFILGNESKQQRASLYSHILSDTYFEQLFF